MLVVEVIMLVAGLWALITAKLPSLLFGGAKWKYEGRGVRWLGLILVLPLPLAFLSAMVLGLLLGEQGIGYASILEIAIVVIAGIAAIVVGRLIRQPATVSSGEGTAEDVTDVEATIAKKARGSLIYAILSILGPVALVGCPLAYIRSKQALRLIDQHQVGEEHRGTAKTARTLSAIIFLGWVAVIVVSVGLFMAAL